MKEISRREAEALVRKARVVSSDVVQSAKEMRVTLVLDDDTSFLVRYDLKDHAKSYFLKG